MRLSVGYLRYPRGEGTIYGEANSKGKNTDNSVFTAGKPDFTAKEILI